MDKEAGEYTFCIDKYVLCTDAGTNVQIAGISQHYEIITKL